MRSSVHRLGGSPNRTPGRIGALQTFAGAGADKLLLEFGEAAKYGQYQPAVSAQSLCASESRRRTFGTDSQALE
jgi:hypothetical protein